MDGVYQWVAGSLSLATGTVAVVLRPRGLASWVFFAGMLLLGLEQWLPIWESTDSLRSLLMVKSLIPGFWLGFSLIYARGNRWEFLDRWKWLLLSSILVPVTLASGLIGQVSLIESTGEASVLRYTGLGKLWTVVLLLSTLGILVNLEKTFRDSVGMARWRIKYLFLGASLIFGVRVYGLSQALLYSGSDSSMADVESVSLIIGCILIGIGHTRSSFGKLDIYPSRALLQGSITVVLAGAYFLIVGLLAQLVGYLGGASSLPAQAFLLLLGLVSLTVLLLSDRFRSWLKRFVSRHFRRPEHDFRKLWSDFTHRTSNVLDEAELGKQAAEVISESFQVLGVTVLRASPESDSLSWLHTTDVEGSEKANLELSEQTVAELSAREGAYDLEGDKGAFGKVLRDACPSRFEHGGDRIVVPLKVADRLIGLVVLADRVNGIPYSHEELDLLNCIGDQFAAGLLNCALSGEVLQAKELEAFQTLSTFFVHDLKNAANSLNLTLQNLPVHFDDPEFRKDAISSVGRTVERINKMILNLSSLRRELQLRKVPTRLDHLTGEVLDELEGEMGEGRKLERRIDPLPETLLDAQAMRSVLTNLVTNARESIAATGTVRVSVGEVDGFIRLLVEDEGSGMPDDFIRNQLFRPFHSTKTKGLGIGMFQCKKVVEAHDGSLRVESQVGQGTRFTIDLPVHFSRESQTTPS